MIIGRGDIASVLHELDTASGRLWFASGVSNSEETRISEYEREKKLLLEQNRDFQIVYFSSLCVFYADTPYARHKREMEALIKKEFPKYAIIRVGNITWGKNPHTLLNFFREKINKNEEFEIRDAYRYIIDKLEFLHWLGMIPEWNCEMNLTGTKMKVSEIADMLRREQKEREKLSHFS